MEILRSTFKPEFLNRIDDIIIFRSLTVEDIDKIINIQINLLQKRLEERKLFLELTEKAKNYISREGYSPIYGARPLKRALQKLLLDNLSMKILEGNFVEGDRILADVDDRGEINFMKKNINS
ncbi:MAG: Chaperone protein ClpB [Syntrophus sp. PtaB.Bin001]|nr:MAG: Chaperone protein ClpB [Syntrophus sp. PtaB.Bin001]